MFFRNLLNIIYVFLFLILSFLISYNISESYLIDKMWLFNFNLSNLSKVYVIKQNQVEIVSSDNKNKLKLNNNFTLFNNTKNDKFTIDNAKYISLWKNKYPIVSTNLKNSNNQKIDKLLDLDFVVRSKNVILAHSSWKILNLWKYFVNYKKWDTIQMYDIYGNKHKYKVIKRLIMDKKDYIKNFVFYKDKIYMITCYPLWNNTKRFILILEKDDK